jgi:hypothetical protein
MLSSLQNKIMKCINFFFRNYKLQNDNFVTKTIVSKKKCYKIKKNRSQYNVVSYNLVSKHKNLKTVQIPVIFIQDEPSIKLCKESNDKESHDKEESNFGPYLRYMYQMS